MSDISTKQPRDEKAYWIARVSQNGLELEQAPPAFKGDREVVLAAVAQNPKALQCASTRLRAGGLALYVGDILAFSQYVFGRRNKQQSPAGFDAYSIDLINERIGAYMGIQFPIQEE